VSIARNKDVLEVLANATAVLKGAMLTIVSYSGKDTVLKDCLIHPIVEAYEEWIVEASAL
jgi:hypothetical protein